ncbi:MAG: zinc ribbon domain-containing protein [Vicinamibacterales bacterium]|nr:zinc ribbon domain-containing protein [Vicinamibacterales bacterium]
MAGAMAPGRSTPRGPAPAAAPAAALQPWQFFLLAGMLGATAVVFVSTGQSMAAILALSATVVSSAFVGLGVYRSLAPLVDTSWSDTPEMVGGQTRAALEREKFLVLRSIKELEFDFAMGKIAQADFDEMASLLRTRAIRLMRDLEAGSEYRRLIESELEVRLGRKPEPLPPPSTPPLPEAAAPAAGSDAPAVQYCPQCGVASDRDARFCKACGTKLAGDA